MTSQSQSQTPSLPSTLVARFLRTNNYTETLRAFIREAGLPNNVGQPSISSSSSQNNHGESSWTIEGVLEEKKAFDKSVNFERYGGDEKERGEWSVPAPTKPNPIQTPNSANLLACSVEPWKQAVGGDRDGEEEEGKQKESGAYLVATGADRQLHLFTTATGNHVVKSFSSLSDSPILSYTTVRNGRYVLLTNMSGQLLLQRGAETLDCRKDHAKYAVKVVAHEEEDAVWIATAGWDSKVVLYRLSIPIEESETGGGVTLGEPAAYITLASNPESMLFVRHVDTGELILLVSRRDSTHLHYYQVNDSSALTPYECPLLGTQNLAPHSNAWVAFSPSCLALSPDDPGLLAVAASTTPHMKVLLVRLLFPSQSEASDGDGTEPHATQATQALAALSLQNREDAAILIQANTFAPQTAYSTPQVVWRPDGSGVWVNGDDGVIRGVERRTGKVAVMLKDGHDTGYKVRSIWAGWVDVVGDGGEVVREEWLVSGGFDKKLIVWKAG
ncbi:hypothetical protein P168DRAFT_326607 [Aspergillus campestris IBT 28561]|uniref:Uncharacterized protein n=1 Tax=Aspergillus campestris (strain IBT 28561) TaxID=1392248 RepID=A0A2I1D4N5_ASPC2|nr:uncharacterized protein P168DRAFT_326607 [Aspergillus campestris IBT 28561]PKY04826.1 hypothetical protein P168DRAFT_326607 [Aspergillus campestris IBT 28561]